jgi:hypothetical protein
MSEEDSQNELISADLGKSEINSPIMAGDRIRFESISFIRVIKKC